MVPSLSAADQQVDLLREADKVSQGKIAELELRFQVVLMVLLTRQTFGDAEKI